jgi:hypothetical protein
MDVCEDTCFGVFSRTEQRVLQTIFDAIAEGGGTCVATIAMLARASNTSKSTTRNAIAQAVEIGLLEKTERLPMGATVALRMPEPTRTGLPPLNRPQATSSR